ncbi:MAG: hypothetical protein NTZ57_10260, partial [Deltaproteobacteria bacterium]|nr:hypothetical protein [Deltaproteobacteria bacterium]
LNPHWFIIECNHTGETLSAWFSEDTKALQTLAYMLSHGSQNPSIIALLHEGMIDFMNGFAYCGLSTVTHRGPYAPS